MGHPHQPASWSLVAEEVFDEGVRAGWMRHGGAAALRCDDLKRQILVHGTPPFRDLPEILNDNGGQYQQSVGFGCALWARREGRWDASADRQAQGAGKARRGHQSVAGVVAFLRTSALPLGDEPTVGVLRAVPARILMQ